MQSHAIPCKPSIWVSFKFAFLHINFGWFRNCIALLRCTASIRRSFGIFRACHLCLESSRTLAFPSSLRGLRVESKLLSEHLRFTSLTTPIFHHVVSLWWRTGPKDAATYRSQSQILVPMVGSSGWKVCSRLYNSLLSLSYSHTWSSNSGHFVTVKTSAWIWRVKLNKCLIPRWCPQEKTFLYPNLPQSITRAP